MFRHCAGGHPDRRKKYPSQSGDTGIFSGKPLVVAGNETTLKQKVVFVFVL